MNFNYDFKQKGNFIGLVTARSDDGAKVYVSRFPFAVGETASKDMIIYSFLTVCGLVAFGLWYEALWARRSRAPLEPTLLIAGGFNHENKSFA